MHVVLVEIGEEFGGVVQLVLYPLAEHVRAVVYQSAHLLEAGRHLYLVVDLREGRALEGLQGWGGGEHALI